MNLSFIVSTLVVIVSFTGVIVYFVRTRRKKRKLPAYFSQKWLDVQRLCASKDTWAKAVTDADNLLDQALKKRRFKGKSMGERMVAAQRKFSNNDGVWYAHNLAKKLLAHPRTALRESEIKKALIGVRQALRDLEFLNGK